MKNFFKNYIVIENNIYSTNKVDAVLYLAVYVLVPVVVTLVGFLAGSKEPMDSIYWYISIIITTIGVLYDCYGRWDANDKSIKNTKIFLMGVSAVIILAYSFFEIVCISQGLEHRDDRLLLTYALLSIIAIIDLMICFCRNMAFSSNVS